MKLKGYRRILPFSERAGIRARLENPALSPLPADSVENGFIHAPQAAWQDPGVANPATNPEFRRLKKILDEGSPDDNTPKHKRAVEKEIRELEGVIRPHMAPRDFFQMKREDSKDYDKVVQHQVTSNADPTLGAMKQRLQSLLRERYPQNPKAGSLEYLREDGRIKT